MDTAIHTETDESEPRTGTGTSVAGLRALLQFRDIDLDATRHDDVTRLLTRHTGTEPFGIHGHLRCRQVDAFRRHRHCVGGIETADDYRMCARRLAIEAALG